jgi:hypothetical protein
MILYEYSYEYLSGYSPDDYPNFSFDIALNDNNRHLNMLDYIIKDNFGNVASKEEWNSITNNGQSVTDSYCEVIKSIREPIKDCLKSYRIPVVKSKTYTNCIDIYIDNNRLIEVFGNVL